MTKKILTLDNIPVIKKNIGRIDTIEKLKASTIYSLGDVVEVLGFHAKGDGSHHKRIAKAEDDGSGEQGQNGIWWCVVHSGEVNVSWFGAKGDGITDDTVAIQKVFLLDLNKVVFSGSYKLGDVFFNILNKDIDLNNSTLEFTGNKVGFFLKNNSSIMNGTIKVNHNGGVGHGGFGCCINIADYDRVGSEEVKNVTIKNINLYSDKSNSNGILLTGNSKEIVIENISTVEDPKNKIARMVLCHWGYDNYDATQGTYHPHNITISNVYSNHVYENLIDAGVIFISACHNIDIQNVYSKHSYRGIQVFSGDYGYNNAKNCDKEEFLKNINIKNVILKNSTNNAIAVQMDEVFIPSFDYKKSSVVFDNFVAINTNTNVDVSGVLIRKSDGVELNNIHLIGGILGNAYNISDSTNIKLDRLNLDNVTTTTGVNINNASYISFSDSIISGSNTGVKIQDCTNISLDRIISKNSTYASFNFDGTKTKNINVINCKSLVEGSVQFHYRNGDNSNSKYEFIFDSFVGNVGAGDGIGRSGNDVLIVRQIQSAGSKDFAYEATSNRLPTFGKWRAGSIIYKTNIGTDNIIGWTCVGTGEYGTSTTPTWKIIKCENVTSTLDTPYYTLKMQQEGIYQDYIAYRDELHEYENSLATDETMLLPVLQEPEIPESVKQFAEKYKLI